MIFASRTPKEQAWRKLRQQETAFLRQNLRRSDSAVERLVAERVPPRLRETLEAAFVRAFGLVFEKGDGVIGRACRKTREEQAGQTAVREAARRGDRGSLRAVARQARRTAGVNLLVSGAAGTGLGLLGIGLPDLVLWIGLLRKSLCELALSYGFSCEGEEEERFMLLVICGALSHGEALGALDRELDGWITGGRWQQERTIAACRTQAAGCLAGELLYLKFLQGIPVVGVIGGAYDAVYLRRVTRYAELKYRRRFLTGR